MEEKNYNEEETVRRKIILAAIECIEKEGIGSVTTRGIAKEAGVNSAAINYYFRTKEQLIKIAMQQTLDEAFKNNVEEFLGTEANADFFKALEGFFVHTLEGALNYPNITMAHLFHKKVPEFSTMLASFLEYLYDRSGKFAQIKNTGNLKFAVIQITCAAMLPVLLSDDISIFLGKEFKNKNIIRSYVKELLEHYFDSN